MVELTGRPLSTNLAVKSSETPYSEEDMSQYRARLRRDKILCIGAGYVGAPTMAMIASKCPDLMVYVVDVSEEKIASWNSASLPVYEPGLQELVEGCRGKNLFFSTDVPGLVNECDIIFISVNTPTKSFGVGAGRAADLSWWDAASRCVARYATTSKIVIEKSTVPVRTAENLRQILICNKTADDLRHVVLSNPEFLAEGSAIYDLEYPDRVLIGGCTETSLDRYAVSILVDIYGRWVPRDKILMTNTWSAELSKLAANACLAQRISSINAIAMLCEKTGADVREVGQVIGRDSRIGPKFLSASVGFGGSCLEKDILNLAYLCEFYGLHEAASYWMSIKHMNDAQKKRFSHRIIRKLCSTVFQKSIAVFGFAFKANTSDTRQTAALDICATLMADGALLNLYDPCVSERGVLAEFKAQRLPRAREFDLSTQLTVLEDPKDAVKDAHAIVILTEFASFNDLDYASYYTMMKKPAYVFDGRNILDQERLRKIGYKVYGIGTNGYHPSG